jgi:hypothetical protein
MLQGIGEFPVPTRHSKRNNKKHMHLHLHWLHVFVGCYRVFLADHPSVSHWCLEVRPGDRQSHLPNFHSMFLPSSARALQKEKAGG